MSRQLVSFLIGVGISSAWWSLAVVPKGAGPTEGIEWTLPIISTLAFGVFVGWWLLENWDDQ